MTGLSSRNLKYMRAFATAWSDKEIVQEALARITWYHNLVRKGSLPTVEEIEAELGDIDEA